MFGIKRIILIIEPRPYINLSDGFYFEVFHKIGYLISHDFSSFKVFDMRSELIINTSIFYIVKIMIVNSISGLRMVE